MIWISVLAEEGDSAHDPMIATGGKCNNLDVIKVLTEEGKIAGQRWLLQV